MVCSFTASFVLRKVAHGNNVI